MDTSRAVAGATLRRARRGPIGALPRPMLAPGCFVDVPSRPQLSRAACSPCPSLTILSCAMLCDRSGSSLFGLRNGSACLRLVRVDSPLVLSSLSTLVLGLSPPYKSATLEMAALVNCTAGVETCGAASARLRWSAACTTDSDAPGATLVSGAGPLKPGINQVRARLVVPRPALWHVRGVGPQHLYEARLELIADAEGAHAADEHAADVADNERGGANAPSGVIDSIRSPFGIRHLEYAENVGTPSRWTYIDEIPCGPRAPGGGYNCTWPPKGLTSAEVTGNRSWTFQINGRRTFAHGANWLPCDMAMGVCDASAYEVLLGAAAHANINFLRVWGGTGFEKDAFYDAADRLGIMVVQEMPMSQVMPDRAAHADLPAVMRAQEADITEAVKRLRGRPSLVRWGYGNEIYGVNRSSNPFERQYEQIVTALDPTRRATHGSPVTWVARHGPYCFYFVGGRGDDNSSHSFPCTQTAGYAAYNSGTAGEAVMNQEGANDPMEWDEYGSPGMSSVATLRKWMPPPSLAYPSALSARNADWVYHRGFGAIGSSASPYWADRDAYLPLFGALPSLAVEVAVSQWSQAEALRYANQAHRRRMPHRSMSAFWSFNAPFANAAYLSVVDFGGASPKMAYYAAVRKAYAEVDVSLRYDGLLLRAAEPARAAIWVVTECAAGTDATAHLSITTLAGVLLHSQQHAVSLPDDPRGPGTAVQIGELQWTPEKQLAGAVLLVRLSLESEARVRLAEQVYTFAVVSSAAAPEPMRPLLSAPGAHIGVALEAHSGAPVATITNLGTPPALYVHLELRGGALLNEPQPTRLSDDYFTLWRGESIDVLVELLPGAVAGPLSLCVSAWNDGAARVEEEQCVLYRK